MKDFFKKYPGLIIFIGIGILLTLLFIFYEIMYNGQNRKQQAAYEELNKNAWITEFEPYHVDTGDDDADFRAENEAKEKAFLEEVENADYFRKQLATRPNFETFWEVNDDVIGFILVPNTKIEYPILQSDARRDYYLKRNIDGSTGYPGCIYIENINNPDLSDCVTIAYGHNMKNGTMFGQLHKFYRDRQFLTGNRYFFVYQPDRVSVYEIDAVTSYSELHLLADNFKKEGNNFMFTGIKPDDQVKIWNNLKAHGDKNAYFDESAEVSANDKFFVMSTCNGDRARMIVVGKLLFTHLY